jgi:hypothetical protein
MKRAKKKALWFLLVPLWLLLLIIFICSIPLMILHHVKASLSLRIFCRREAGNVYLICTSRRNWYDFIRNNLIPVLPKSVRVVAIGPGRSPKKQPLFQHLSQSSIGAISRPYLVSVTRRGLTFKSLNAALFALKTRPKKSESAQKECARILNEVMTELQARA